MFYVKRRTGTHNVFFENVVWEELGQDKRGPAAEEILPA